jgi:hypothetical protein
MTKLEYTFTSDTLFKMLFVKFPELLKRLVAAIIGIPVDSTRNTAAEFGRQVLPPRYKYGR